MKLMLSTLLFCLIALSGFSQPAKYSFDEVSYGPREKTKHITVKPSEIDNVTGAPKYTVTADIDIEHNKFVNSYVYLSGEGIQGQLCMGMITHVSYLYLGGVNTGGVEAYACRNALTNVVFYFLVGATTPDTLKFLFYAPSGPTELKAVN